MAPRPYSLAEARNHLTQLVREVERGKTIGLTRRGRLVAVVVSEADYHRLSGGGIGLRSALAEFMRDRPKGGVLTAGQLRRLRDRSPGRRVST